MLFEPHHRFNTNFVRSTQEGLAFLDAMNHEAVGFLIDSFHMNIEDASFAGSIREAGARIDYFHIADNTRTYPGSGHIAFDEIIAALKEVGYAGLSLGPTRPEARLRDGGDEDDGISKGAPVSRYISGDK